MSDPRDDLAALIELTEFGYDTERRPPSAWGYSLADAILAAGWRPPSPLGRKPPPVGFPCPSCGRPGAITHLSFNADGQEMTISHPYIGGVPGQGPTDPCHLDDAATSAFVRTWPTR